ncbi:hypothetical protein, partial [Mesorhizobium sp. M4B.F.Ca.ET.089.01.1.1]
LVDVKFVLDLAAPCPFLQQFVIERQGRCALLLVMADEIFNLLVCLRRPLRRFRGGRRACISVLSLLPWIASTKFQRILLVRM